MQTHQTQLDTLRFMLYERPLHPELFDIRRGLSCKGRTYEAQVWITGCSHVVSFHAGQHSLCEVVADSRLELPSTKRVVNIPFAGEKTHHSQHPEDISYMMNLQVETASKRVYTEMHQDLINMGRSRGNLIMFPRWRHDPLPPFAFISCEARPDQFHIMAFHSFPDNMSIIKIQSIFEVL